MRNWERCTLSYHATTWHRRNCFTFSTVRPALRLFISWQYEFALCSSGKPEASLYSVMTGVNPLRLIPVFIWILRVIVVRYADDMVLGFQHRAEAERFLQDWRERLQKFELELHPDKTRLIEFGRFAAVGRKQRGEGKPETFNFLGFTHICGQSWKNGKCFVLRKTIRKRLLAKLKQVKIALWKRMHQSLAEVGKWLRRVVQGYFNYHAVPGNLPSLRSFRFEVRKRWLRVIRRRSQRSGMTWELMDRFAAEWLPEPKILHPYPNLRFDAKHPRSTLRVSSSYRRSLRTDRTAGRFLKGCWGKAVIRYHLPRRVRSGLPISLADCDGAFSPVLFF
jgi:hypothetical protein